MTSSVQPLTRRGVPLERDLRVLAIGSFANRFARALMRGSIWIAAGFAIVSLADRGDVTFAIAVLVAGSLVHVVGEMIGSGGQWGLQMGLAPHTTAS